MINAPLHIAALPLDIKLADPTANLTAIEEALAGLRSETDLLVLPELFSTGFVSNPKDIRRLAESDSGSTLTRLRQFAHAKKIAIAGSYLAHNLEATEFYNRGFFIEPNGETTYVNKRHLFHVSPEAELLTEGKTPYPVIRYRGWNIALGICYDLRFPVWCRNVTTRARSAYDIFLLPANWPQARALALETLAKARAIENQAYYVVANRSGVDEFGEYDGLTFIEDYVGTRVAQSTTSEIAYAVADREGLEKLRQYMPAGLDSDTFSIKY